MLGRGQAESVQGILEMPESFPKNQIDHLQLPNLRYDSEVYSYGDTALHRA